MLLLQLAPKLEFELAQVEAFLARLSGLALANLACEPRHRSWFSEPATQLLTQYKVARVGPDQPSNGRGSLQRACLPPRWHEQDELRALRRGTRKDSMVRRRRPRPKLARREPFEGVGDRWRSR